MAQLMAKIVEEYGPYGSQGRPTFRLVLDKADIIKVVNIRAGDIVDGIGFGIVAEGGDTQMTWFGGDNGVHHTIIMKYGERITRLSGKFGDWTDNGRHIISIKVHTNLFPHGYGPYGLAKDCKNIKSFQTPKPDVGPIVGFLGVSGHYLDSIGVYIEKVSVDLSDVRGPHAF